MWRDGCVFGHSVLASIYYAYFTAFTYAGFQITMELMEKTIMFGAHMYRSKPQ